MAYDFMKDAQGTLTPRSTAGQVSSHDLSKTPAQGTTREALESLEHELSLLVEAMSALEERLKPSLRPSASAPECMQAVTPGPPVSALTLNIYNATNAVRGLRTRLLCIHERLDL